MLTLFRCAFALYVLSTLLSFAYLYSRDEKLATWKYRFLGIGLGAHCLSALHMLFVFWSHPENQFLFPTHSFFCALSLLAVTNALILFIVEGYARLRILAAFVLPWSCLAAGAALFASPELGPLAPALRSFRLNLHPVLLMFSYTVFANAFGVGLALLIQERQIKSRKPTELCYRLPPIEELDQLHFRIIMAIFPVLTLGLLLGTLWAKSAWNSWITDAKVISTAVTWTIYLVFLYMRGFGGMRGRKPVYIALLGFASIIFTFFIVNYLSAEHGYLYGR